MNVVRCTCHKDPVACRVPHGMWLVIRRKAGGRYPCLCRPGRACSPIWCPCAGRLDLVEASCCARINTPDVVTAARKEHDRARRARG